MSEKNRSEITNKIEKLLHEYVDDVKKDSIKPVFGVTIIYVPNQALWIKVLKL